MNLKKNIYLVNFFTAIIPILIISMATYFIFSEELEELEEEKIEFISRTIEKYLDEKISNSLEMLIYLEEVYKNEDNYLEAIRNGGSDKERTDHMLHHMGKLSTLENTVKFIAYGTAEKQIFFDKNAGDQNLPSDYDPTTRTWYIGALNSEDYYLSEIFIHVGTKEPVVTISKKIEVNGRVEGVLTALLDLSVISKTLSEYKIGEKGSFFVLDKNNRMLIGSDKDKEKLSYIADMDLNIHEFKKNTPEGKVIYHIYKLKKLDAVLVGVVFEKDLNAPLYRLKDVVFMILVIVILIISTILFIFGKFFDRSLDRLSCIVNSISSGDYTKNIDKLTEMIGEKSELKIIKDAIKNMNYEIVKRETELKYISKTDPLTKIYNRRAIISFIEVEIQRSKNFKSEYTLIMLDLDKFKRLNDKFGHLFGDEVLREVCKIISYNIKDTDKFGRYGGEEFLILLPDTVLSEGIIIAQRLRKKIEEMKWKNDVVVTASMGVIRNMKADTLDLTLERVDNLLYKAKNNGRNRVEYQKI
ncbi:MULTISPECIES: sensor domain-containing diguanylate cyclase [Psychrilyobacter]|uniref:Diguanylate cyclase n=1 Tax=Psychrilyobacter piezotolerans TaxID=2293438 RepID=A0ABX9KH72_9FUSO|nr:MULTISPECIES: diguanylate cyclase [Psychrilyobacter]MCS5420687.1 diguanylate cyclase [Psychrilyobacter sp. S5]NDI77861.1 GGDEF domain-containing protein [Psychrilyobacter piezotolerans]RDE62284.1 GGDEF domain-containing protein [Psychrilyobacter sp. S5]REI41382.1 diguanylate cyclase [Psychrilyobacter piezotolerans]